MSEISNAKLTPTNFIVPITRDNGNEVLVWVGQPSNAELLGISRILAYINKETATSSLAALLMDWERLVEESLMDMPPNMREEIKRRLNVFFERAAASAVCNEGDFNLFSDDEKHLFKGSLLFISALFRYFTKAALNEGTKAFFTSLNSTEWKQSFVKQSATSTEETPIQKAGERKPSISIERP